MSRPGRERDDLRNSVGVHHADTCQTAEELTEWLEANTAAAATTGARDRGKHEKRRPASLLEPPASPSSLTWNAADVIALYLRRQRYAILRETEDGIGAAERTRDSSSSASRLHDDRLLESYSPKLLLLGEDAVVQELATTLRAEAERDKGEVPSATSVNGRSRSSRDGTLGVAQHLQEQSGELAVPLTATSTDPLPEVYTIPDAVVGLDALRAELCRWCDVILFCYRVADPASFVYLQNNAVPAVLAACSAEEEEAEADGRGHDDSISSARVNQRFVSGSWPLAMPPLILVGLGAEARLSRPTDLQAPWITNADVLGFAAEAGVQRVVELYSHHPRHVQILLQHCRTLRDVGYERLASPAAQGRRAALKELGLHALLRAPPPTLELRPGARAVHVALPPHVPAPDGVRCYYSVSDAADVNDVSSVVGSCLVPVSGILSCAEIYDAYTQSTGRPAQHAAAIQLTACTVVPYLFPSEAVHQRIPTPAAPPSGYVDVVHRCCRVTLPSSLSSSSSCTSAPPGVRGGDASRSGGHSERPTRVRCTLGDSTTEMEILPSTLRDGSPCASTSLCIPLDGEKPTAASAFAEVSDFRSRGGAWQPWPSTLPAPSQPRLLRVEVDAGEEDDAAAHVSRVSSSPFAATATFVIPPVLPPPVVEYSALDRSLRMHVPGYRADQVEIRYTLDGSVPTSTTGQLYKDAVLLCAKQGRVERLSNSARKQETVVHVRAVAFPKMYFASRVTEAHIGVNEQINPLPTPAEASVQLQDDEHLDSDAHVQWGSPTHLQRTVKSLPAASSQLFQQPQKQTFNSPRTPRSGRASLRARCRTPMPRHGIGGSLSGSDAFSVVSDAPMTRSAELRQAFNAGLYTPPRHPFSQGEGFTPSSRLHKRGGRR